MLILLWIVLLWYLYSQDGPFAWDENIQGLILAAYFYGYIVTQVNKSAGSPLSPPLAREGGIIPPKPPALPLPPSDHAQSGEGY